MDYQSDVEHALLSFASTFPPYDQVPLTKMGEFSNGLVFAHMLVTVDQFPLLLRELEVECPRWIERLANLKKIVQKIQAYVGEGGKLVRTKDIDLIEVVKHNSSEHILRLFELVITVFMQSPHKESYIQTIMNLDERSQQALVVIVQNAIHERLADSSDGLSQAKLLQHLQDLTNENQLFREDLEGANASIEKYKRENVELRERLEDLEEVQEKQRKQTIDSGNEQTRQEIDQLKSLNDSLKQKLLHVVREHEQELSRIRQENIFLQNKMLRFKEYQEAVEQLKEQLAEMQGDRQRTSQHQKERRRLSRVIEQKQSMIGKLRQKMQQISEKNVNMQQHELNMKMQMERKEFRFKHLQSEVKSRLKAEPFLPSPPILPVQTTTADTEQLDYLQQQVQKLRTSGRELDRDNVKLKKKLEKMQGLEGEKKKLEKIILDVSKAKEAEIEMLVVSLYELRNENIRMHQMLKST